jgi:uncharacterized protein YdhG (YjbR/CyaY superfamily)
MSADEIDAYLAAVPEPQRTTLSTMRATLQAILPEADEGLAYGVPAYRVGGVAVAGFASATRHCSYFPMSGTVLAGLADQLAGYSTSKGALRFAVDDPLPPQMVRLLVDARLAEIPG